MKVSSWELIPFPLCPIKIPSLYLRYSTFLTLTQHFFLNYDSVIAEDSNDSRRKAHIFLCHQNYSQSDIYVTKGCKNITPPQHPNAKFIIVILQTPFCPAQVSHYLPSQQQINTRAYVLNSKPEQKHRRHSHSCSYQD